MGELNQFLKTDEREPVRDYVDRSQYCSKFETITKQTLNEAK
jgi:hypothetical protein